MLNTQAADLLLVVPTFQHAFGKQLAPFEDRLAMCKLAMARLANAEVSAIEQELGGESLTLRTIEHLKDKHPDWILHLVMGTDVMATTHLWKDFDRLTSLAPPAVVGRFGFHSSEDLIIPEVSSTVIRDAIAKGREEQIAHLLPLGVLDYIKEHKLYLKGL